MKLSSSRLRIGGLVRVSTSLWPAIVVTLLTGAGFAGLKFVLINEIAFSDHADEALPFSWWQHLIAHCERNGTVDEAVGQGLAAILTLGVLIGFVINSPLAGAWRTGRLFMVSCAGVAAGCLATLWFNPFVIALLVGVFYGAACAARGKVIPLIARATLRANTMVSGFINASLVIGLLSGTVLGNILGEYIVGDQASLYRHALLALLLLVATALSLLVRPPEPPVIPFARGMYDLIGGTWRMLRGYWALLISGGLAWGIASAASLAVFIDGVDRLKITPTQASFMALFAAIGAILGNLASHYFRRRWHTLAALGVLGVCVLIYPYVIHGWVGAAAIMVVVGATFAAPANVLDARLLALTGAEGLAGRGSTVMSLVHNIVIFAVGTGLAGPLLMGWMKPEQQFWFLALVAAAAVVVAWQADLHDADLSLSVRRPAAPGIPSVGGGER